MAAMSLEQFSENYRDTIDRLYSISNASAWQVSRESFAALCGKVSSAASVRMRSLSHALKACAFSIRFM